MSYVALPRHVVRRRPTDIVLGRVLGAMVNSSMVRHGTLPSPQDVPVVHATGPDPDRLLLIGSGAVRGNGVMSNELGLGGQLARRVASLTGRGVDIELASSDTLTISQAPDMLAGYDTSRFDAIVVTVGARDVINMTGRQEWCREVRRLLEVASRAPQVFMVAIPDFAPYLDIPSRAASLLRRQGERLNDATRAIVADIPGVEFVPFAPEPPDSFFELGSVVIYESWAELLAPEIALGLDPVLHGLRATETVDEHARQRALDALGVVDSDSDLRVDRIARLARDLLGASGASVTFLDHDRQWIKSAVSMSTDDMARLEAFCNTTISKAELFVIEDAAKDARFAHHPWVVGDEHVRFYAGYPLEAPGGVRVGALCVVDTKPRTFTGAEAALLREFALRVQALLWSTVSVRHSES